MLNTDARGTLLLVKQKNQLAPLTMPREQALSIYLLVVIAQKKLNIPCPLYTLLQILEVNLFEKKLISSLVADALKQIQDLPDDNQLNLFNY